MGRMLAGALLGWALMGSGVAKAHGAFLVNSTSDHDDGACEAAPEGDCTLREAISGANALINDHPDAPDTISFDFGVGRTAPFTIVLGAPLPTISEAAIIDGASEPRYILSRDKKPVVVIEGAGVETLLRVRSEGTLIVSLGFNHATVSAIDAEYADYLLIRGCYFGIDVETGDATSLGQAAFGAQAIYVRDTFRARIGGLDELSRNVIAGAGAEAIRVERVDNLLLHGNYVGIDPTGLQPRPNALSQPLSFSIDVRASRGIEVKDNVASSNLGPGIGLRDTPEAIVEGNRIGVDTEGRNFLGNGGSGLVVSGDIDGLLAADNIVSSNAGDGITCEGPATGQWAAIGNTIGVDIGRSQILSNSGHGISVGPGCEGAAIGTVGLGQGNVIGHNGQSGIRLVDGTGSARGNSLFFNEGLGIDAANDGVTPNDVDDVEMPVNFPEIREVIELEGGIRINGCTVKRATIDVYAASIDPSGFGEGATYLGSITEGSAADEDSSTGCSPHNDSAFSYLLETQSVVLTLTATHRGHTSEFSALHPDPTSEPNPGCSEDASCELPTPLCNGVLQECVVCIDDANDTDIDAGCTEGEPRCVASSPGTLATCQGASTSSPDPMPPPPGTSARGCGVSRIHPETDALGGSWLILMALFGHRLRRQ